ncbi:MAG: hypothetical protein VX553_04985, partial [Pseudomonadota bacterium]|nr:hypothetical protein [Pseudomonadota bacterium]
VGSLLTFFLAFHSAGHLTDMGRRAVASATDPAASQPTRPAELPRGGVRVTSSAEIDVSEPHRVRLIVV